VNEHNPDVICGSESHLDQSFYSSEIFPDSYNVFRKDRTLGGGGVFLCIKKQLQVLEEPSLDTDTELIWIKLTPHNQSPIHICAFYRPPTSDLYPMEQLRLSLTNLLNQSKSLPNILLMGDFNFPGISWNNGHGQINTPTYGSRLNSLFLEIINDAGLEQFVHQATRQNNVLDLVFSTHPNIDNLKTVPGISDHDAITFDLQITYKPTTGKNQHSVALYHKGDIQSIKNDLVTFGNNFRDSDPQSRTVDQLWKEFKEAVHKAVIDHVPHRVNKSRSRLPWINRQIKADMKVRKRLYNKAKRSNLQHDWDAYRKMKNSINTKLKEAHNNYYTRLFDNSFNGSRRQFWKYIKAKRQDKPDIPALFVDDKPIHSSKDKANALNSHFKSVFTTEDLTTIPTIDNHTDVPDMPDISISEAGIYQLLTSLDEHKASGPDRISAYILKHCAGEIAPILHIIFTRSLSTNLLPNDWLKANICPVHKKGSRSNIANYRPISLTSICAKILEHIIYHSIMKHLNQNNILIENQHGFRSNHSCVTQLITLTENISSALDHRKQVDIILLDFSKAFDTVPHQRLLTKLKFYGINGSTFNWIQTWLTHRSQCVVLDSESSSPVPVLSGVPQGTVLGPLMFLLYINDIIKDIDSPLRLFADDCLLYRVINSADDTRKLQEDLNKLSEWANTWQLRFNVSKCSVIRCTRSRTPFSHDYILNSHILTLSDQHAYLGVILNKSLSWSPHINSIVTKASKTLNFLKRNLNRCSKQVKESAYLTMVRPQIEYASDVWDPHKIGDIVELEKVQRRAARWVMNDYGRFSSVTSMLNQLSWPTLETRRKSSRLQTLHKVIYQQISLTIPSYYLPSSRSTRQQHPLHLILPHVSTSAHQNSYFSRTINDWNLLPIDLIEISDSDNFRTKLQSLLYV